jgi:hypothetical protein
LCLRADRGEWKQNLLAMVIGFGIADRTDLGIVLALFVA